MRHMFINTVCLGIYYFSHPRSISFVAYTIVHDADTELEICNHAYGQHGYDLY